MKKLYYSIGEVSKIVGVEPHVLRYWETIFEELSPRKNRAGNRTYKESDITVILKLKDLIQKKKYSTAGAQKALKESGQEHQNRELQPLSTELQKDLKEIRLFLDKLADAL